MNDHPNAPGNADSREPWRPAQELTVSGFENMPAIPSSFQTDHQAMEFARRYPRNLERVRQRVGQLALFDDASAEKCVYALPRGDKPIIGPSISFAMALWNSYGNCEIAGGFKEVDYRSKRVVCTGAFKDLETNSFFSITATRRVTDKHGKLFNDDMLAVTTQACTSIAVRNALIKCVPEVLWMPVFEQCKIIMRGTQATLSETRAKMLSKFHHYGVQPEIIFRALGVKGEKEITLDQVDLLRGMFQQLKDEVFTPEEMFDPRRLTGQYDETTIENPLGTDDRDRRPVNRTTTNGPGAQRQGAPQGHTAEETRQEGAREVAGAGGTSDGGKPADAQAPQMAGGTGQAAQQQTPASGDDTGGAATATAQNAAGGVEGNGAITTVEQYTAYLADWLARATSATAIDQRYKSEREVRKGLTDLDAAAKLAIEHMKAIAEARFGEST